MIYSPEYYSILLQKVFIQHKKKLNTKKYHLFENFLIILINMNDSFWLFRNIIMFRSPHTNSFWFLTELHTNDLIATLFRLTRYRPNPSYCETGSDCDGRSEFCDLKSKTCVCDDYHVRIENTKDCEICPGDEKPCANVSCCRNKSYQCIDGYCIKCYDEYEQYTCG